MSVEGIEAILLDLEGTLYASGVAIPGAAAALDRLRAAGYRLRFCTNTDSRATASLADGLLRYGLEVAAEEVHTPIVTARQMLAEAGEANAVLLMDAEVRSALAGYERPGPATHVLVADCRETLDYPVLDAAFRAVRAGAELVALQKGRYFKRADGDHIDTGAIVAALEFASGQKARVIGKPSLEYLAAAAALLDVAADRVLVVGDDGGTDVAMGKAAGARTVQVKTGKYADQLSEGAVAQADYVIDSIADLPDLLGPVA